MKKFRRLRLGAMTGLACVALAAPVLASPINPVNTRQVAIPSGDVATLQSEVDAILGPGLDVQTDQSQAGMWSSATFPYLTNPRLAFQGGNPLDTFGIWFGTDTTNMFKLPLLLPGAGIAEFVGISFSAPGTAVVVGTSHANTGTFLNSLITPFGFGFYVENPRGEFFYTADSINNHADALAFDKATNWALAFQDGSSSNPDHYTDYVVTTESLDPVPEPGTLALFGTALFGLAFALRSRQRATE